MKRFESSKSSLFLMELILAILFFSIASAICIQLFVKANSINENAIEKEIAVNKAQNIAEICQSVNLSLEEVQQIIPQAFFRNDGLIIYYDENWQIQSNESGYYQILLLNNTDNIQIVVDGNGILYELNLKQHQPLIA